jgi:hypothetical protein
VKYTLLGIFAVAEAAMALKKEKTPKSRQESSEEALSSALSHASPSTTKQSSKKKEIEAAEVKEEERENDREIVKGVKKRDKQAKKRKNLEADVEIDFCGMRSKEKRKKKKKQKEIDDIEEVSSDNDIASPSAVGNDNSRRATALSPQTRIGQLSQGHDLLNVNSLLIFCRCFSI